MTTKQADIIKELITLLKKGNAHVPFPEAVNGLPAELRGKKVHNLPYTIWQLVEHLRITQWDIVEFCISGEHQSPEWPKGYWTEHKKDVTGKEWETSLKQIKHDQERFFKLLEEGRENLFVPFPYGSGQTLFREAVLIADHNAYHTGEILVLRRLLNSWG